MVIEELEKEIVANHKAEPITNEIEKLMKLKEPLEDRLTEIMTLRVEDGSRNQDKEIDQLQKKITEIDTEISVFIKQQQSMYTGHWGQLMRAGNEESYFAHQVDRFSCVYMAKLGDLFELSPRTYFRAPRRPLAHEM